MASATIKRLKLGVIAFYLVLFAGLALYDERPDPDMAAEMTRPLSAFTGPANAYIALLGFDAPAGKTPYDGGQEKLQEMEKTRAARTNIVAYLSSYDSSQERLVFKGERPTLYDKQGKGILNYVSSHPVEAAKLVSDNKELLKRYRSLFSYTEYREPLDYGYYMPIPMISPTRGARILYFFEIADKARRGDVRGALVDLQKDMEFWRMISRNATTLISKLVSLTMLGMDMRFAAELGTVGPLDAKESVLLQNVLRPFDTGETSVAAAFRGEARYSCKGAELTIYRDSRVMDKLLYKRNATDNRMYAGVREMVRLSELAPDTFAKEAKVREREDFIPYRMGPRFLYNPAGEMLMLIGRSQGLHRYIERGHGVEGLRRLAWLKVLAKKEHVRPEQMQQFLDAQPVGFKDPYTNGPMKWDAKKGSIYFNYATDDKHMEMVL